MHRIKKQNRIIETAIKIFSTNGFYNATISQIASNLNMSVGNFYNYFPSKKSLARKSIVFVSKKLATNLRYINDQDLPSYDKIFLFVENYFDFLQNYPEMIEYFFRVYLSNREIFCENDRCGFSLAEDFVNEVKRLLQDGIKNEEFSQKDFFISFSCIAGTLGGITFLKGEHVLEDDINIYREGIAQSIYNALK